MAGKSQKLGGGGRFEKLSEKIEATGKSEKQANAIAAAAGRAKYGDAKMQSMASAGRMRQKKG